MTIKERIKAYILAKDITERGFCRSLGVSHGYISAMRVSLQPDKIEKIKELYPDLSIEWLLTGEGTMTNGHKRKKMSTSTISAYNQELQNLYLIIKTKDKEIIALKAEIKRLRGLLSSREST